MEHHIKLLIAITCFVLLVYFVTHIISQNIPGMKNVIETLTTDSQHIVYLNEPLEQGSFYVTTHTDEDNNPYSQYIKVTKVETIQNDNDDNYKISYEFLDENNSVPLPRLQHITYTEVSGEDAIKYQNELTLLRNPKPFAPEGQAVRCTNEANTNSRNAIYRYTDGHLRHYPNPTIAASWDKNWGNPSNLDCTNISRGSPMALEPSNVPPSVDRNGLFKISDGAGNYWKVKPGTVELRLETRADASSFKITTLPNMYQMKNKKEGVVILVDGDQNRAIRHGGWVMWAHGFAANNFDFVWHIEGDFTTGAPVIIHNDYPPNREKGTQVGVKANDKKRVTILNPGDANIKTWVFEPVSAASPPPNPAPASDARDANDLLAANQFPIVNRLSSNKFRFDNSTYTALFEVGKCYYVHQRGRSEPHIRILNITNNIIEFANLKGGHAISGGKPIHEVREITC